MTSDRAFGKRHCVRLVTLGRSAPGVCGCLAGLLLLVARPVLSQSTGGASEGPGSSLTRLLDVRVSADEKSCLVIVQTSARVRYTIGQLSNPERLYVDLTQTVIGSELKQRQIAVEGKAIRGVRIAKNAESVTRIVLDLNSRVTYHVSELGSGPGLLVGLSTRQADLGPGVVNATPLESIPSAPTRTAAVPGPRDSQKVRAEFASEGAGGSEKGIAPHEQQSALFTEPFLAASALASYSTSGSAAQARESTPPHRGAPRPSATDQAAPISGSSSGLRQTPILVPESVRQNNATAAEPQHTNATQPQDEKVQTAQKISSVETEPEAANEAAAGAKAPSDNEYVIGPEDVLAIDVWQEQEVSRVVPVRPDGMISLPLAGAIVASGLTPSKLQIQIAKALDSYFRNPQVTVIVQQANSHKYSVMGEVVHPGLFPLTTNTNVLDALAAAGGFTPFAKRKAIYLLRRMPDGSRKRIAFDYRAALSGKTAYLEQELQSGDAVVVP